MKENSKEGYELESTVKRKRQRGRPRWEQQVILDVPQTEEQGKKLRRRIYYGKIVWPRWRGLPDDLYKVGHS